MTQAVLYRSVAIAVFILFSAESAAVKCAQVLVNAGSRNPVQVVCGGYERFSALYPFLRTQKIIWLPQVRQAE